jgi:phosphoribosylanthranilate isomerase
LPWSGGYDAVVAIKVKICGVRTPEDASMAVRQGADFVGIVQVPGAKRRVTIEAAGQIVRAAGPERAVLLFRDAGAGEIAHAVEVTGAATVQLHGSEPAALAAGLPASIGLFKAMHADETLLGKLAEWAGVPQLRAVILEPPGASGGAGVGHDWVALAACLKGVQWPAKVGLMLAGGLTPENVAAGILAVKAAGVPVWGVDVSSGVEEVGQPGKSKELVQRFIRRAREA